jgi:hypothetical protein
MAAISMWWLDARYIGRAAIISSEQFERVFE